MRAAVAPKGRAVTISASLPKAISNALLSVFASMPVMAQGVGAISGTVQDATGGALPM
jgi:hypothetical protein